MMHPIENDPETRLPQVSNQCCSWMQLASFRNVSIALLVTVSLASLAAAAFFAGIASEARQESEQAKLNDAWKSLPIANAVAAVSSEKFSMATAPVSEQGEGLFVLDHNSGLLQCSILYPRMMPPRFMANFTVNVGEALGLDAKGGGYMMVTGTADFQRNNRQPVASSVVYVLDTATGNYACYAIPFDRVAMNANRPQQGAMVLLHQGTANPIINRDDLR